MLLTNNVAAFVVLFEDMVTLLEDLRQLSAQLSVQVAAADSTADGPPCYQVAALGGLDTLLRESGDESRFCYGSFFLSNMVAYVCVCVCVVRGRLCVLSRVMYPCSVVPVVLLTTSLTVVLIACSLPSVPASPSCNLLFDVSTLEECCTLQVNDASLTVCKQFLAWPFLIDYIDCPHCFRCFSPVSRRPSLVCASVISTSLSF